MCVYMYISIYLSIDLSIYLSIYLSVCVCVCIYIYNVRKSHADRSMARTPPARWLTEPACDRGCLHSLFSTCGHAHTHTHTRTHTHTHTPG